MSFYRIYNSNDLFYYTIFKARASRCKKQCRRQALRITCNLISYDLPISLDRCPAFVPKVHIATNFAQSISYFPVVFISNDLQNKISTVIPIRVSYPWNAVNWAQLELYVDSSIYREKYLHFLIFWSKCARLSPAMSIILFCMVSLDCLLDTIYHCLASRLLISRTTIGTRMLMLDFSTQFLSLPGSLCGGSCLKRCTISFAKITSMVFSSLTRWLP